MVVEVPYSAEKVAALRQRHEKGEVVGLKEVAGVFARLDIDVFIDTNPTGFNLFLLALQDLQQDPLLLKSPMGYFEISGIHGLPKRAWNGVQHPSKTGDKKGQGAMGYCEHGSFKFPTWHRPYLMMLEQALYLQMAKRAETFPDASEQYKAVQKFRLPYWDYFRPRDYRTTFPGVTSGDGYTTFPYDFSPPQCFTLERIIVHEAVNKLVTKKFIPNPLKSYHFPLEGGLDESDWELLHYKSQDTKYFARFAKGHTVRHGLRYFMTTKEKKDGIVPPNKYLPTNRETQNRLTRSSQQGNDENLSLTTNARRAPTLSRMKDMILSKSKPFEGYRSYENFATNRLPDGNSGGDGGDLKWQPAGSLEDFHNGWHVNIGSTVGHMGHPGIAAFDPIFYIHHANIDRYLALWQEVNPDAWFNERPHLASEELLPFKSSAPGNTNGFWNSIMVRDTTALGYEFTDIIKGDAKATIERFESQELWSLPKDLKDPNEKVVAPDDKTPLDLSGKLAYQGHPEYLVPYTDAPVVKKPVVSAQMATQHVMALASQTIEKVADTVSDQVGAVSSAEEPVEPLDMMQINFDAFLPMEGSGIPVDWYIDIEVERLALNGPFGLYFFIGDEGGEIKVKPAEYDIAPTLAGIFYNFASPIEACDNCGVQSAETLKITGTTNISHILRDYVINGSLQTLDPDDVKPFLVSRLRWRVLDSQGEKSDPRVLSREHGLKLVVNSLTYVNDGDEVKPKAEFWNSIVDDIIGTQAAQAPMTDDIVTGLWKA